VVDATLTDVFTGNGLDDIVGRGSEQLGDDGELVDIWMSARNLETTSPLTVLSGEQRLALQHLGKDATRTPDVD
jgi:hypothetical protein